MFTSLKLLDYVAITISERILTIEKYVNGHVDQVRYYNAHTYSIEEVKNHVRSYTQKLNSNIVNICDPCNLLRDFNDIGKTYNTNKLIKLAQDKQDS